MAVCFENANSQKSWYTFQTMTKQKTYNFLNAKNIEYEITGHKAVFSMDEICDVVLPHPECDAKNLFVRNDKKREYFLITVTWTHRNPPEQKHRDRLAKNRRFAQSDKKNGNAVELTCFCKTLR